MTPRPGRQISAVETLGAARRHTSSDAPVRVLIADDQMHFRRGLRIVLESSPTPIAVVAEAENGDDAIVAALRVRPDVALLDVRMPGSSGLQAAQALSALVPSTKVLMLTVSDSPEDVALAGKAGAAGYLLKERSLQEVTAAVLAIAHGERWPIAAS
ncbi:MAG: hypothetical protein QOH64_1297 [Acidimicrobiaceae bacterium]|jgi:DNA-binding NarL/FixJ family response regulator